MKNAFHNILLGATALLASGIALSDAPPQPVLYDTALQCQAMDADSRRITWQVQLDESIPLAIVNEDDTPAEYSVGHVRVHLAAGGPSLLIGRSTGRLVLSAPDGSVLARGMCMAPVTT